MQDGLVKTELMDFNFDFQFDKPVIGVDEVGRGSWAGPVMAGAALLNQNLPIDKRLNDSKKLTSKIRMEIFKNLTENFIKNDKVTLILGDNRNVKLCK